MAASFLHCIIGFYVNIDIDKMDIFNFFFFDAKAYLPAIQPNILIRYNFILREIKQPKSFMKYRDFQ